MTQAQGGAIQYKWMPARWTHSPESVFTLDVLMCVTSVASKVSEAQGAVLWGVGRYKVKRLTVCLQGVKSLI